MELRRVTTSEEKAAICERILRALPDWFGIESALLMYVRDVQSMEFFATFDKDPVAFVGLKKHNRSSAEVYVMGVLSEYHRKGLGRRLLQEAETRLSEESFRFLTVKTLSPTKEDENYRRTRSFYERYGFAPLEEFPTLWGENNPCLMLVKVIQSNVALSTPGIQPLIRAASELDAPGIANVHVNAWRETYRGLLPREYLERLPLSYQKRLKMWERCAGDQSGHGVYVAEDNSGIIGFAHTTTPRVPKMADYGELTAIYLFDAVKSQGLGTKLLQEGFSWLKTKGFRKAYCWVLEGNPAANFYEKMGASLNGQEKHDEIGGQKIVELMYVWESLN